MQMRKEVQTEEWLPAGADCEDKDFRKGDTLDRASAPMSSRTDGLNVTEWLCFA